jgi:5-methylcytosine-specific restriction endonuclease McrA
MGAQPNRRPSHPQPPARRPQPVRAVTPTYRPEQLEWPKSFDEWMIDIVRRRALRLNGGARRRGVRGSVRAVELAQILDRSVDAQGRWHCAICKDVVTLDDLSFDHVVALADGGEHAAENLVPAHRKCNEIKGSEKAQSRALAMDRWLDSWASSTPSTGAQFAQDERRYA